ncbi:MAG: ChbG/HpnK family deacetylase [Desulfobacteraceae bacterium]|nr:ChbG/HpnK family deacetylase [Desulfobacteraceae bacterium]
MNIKLVVNADDFGLTRGVNGAIAECSQAGVLRSATIMANGSAFDDAVATAGLLPDLGVGIHFVLTGLKPVSAPEKLPGLLGEDGLLPSGPGRLLKMSLAGRAFRDEIRQELFAQAERVFDSGLRPTHFDCHKHVHLVPAVLDVMIELARRFSVKWIRSPFEAADSLWLLKDVEKGNRSTFLKQYARGLVSRCARRTFHSRIRNAGLRTPDRFYGISTTGFLNENVISGIGAMLRPGVTELMTHPGRLDSDLENCGTRLLQSREIEKGLLVSRRVREIFANRNVIFRNFREVD